MEKCIKSIPTGHKLCDYDDYGRGGANNCQHHNVTTNYSVYALPQCVENFMLSSVCVSDGGGGGGGREDVCLQDFELMQSRQGFRVDE